MLLSFNLRPLLSVKIPPSLEHYNMEVCLVSRGGEIALYSNHAHIPMISFSSSSCLRLFFCFKVQTLSAGERQKDVVGAAAISSLAVIPSPPPLPHLSISFDLSRLPPKPPPLSSLSSFQKLLLLFSFPGKYTRRMKKGGLVLILILWVHSPPDDVQIARFDSLKGKKIGNAHFGLMQK